MGQKFDTLEEAKELIVALNKQILVLQGMINDEVCKSLTDGAIQHWAKDAQTQKKRADTLESKVKSLEKELSEIKG